MIASDSKSVCIHSVPRKWTYRPVSLIWPHLLAIAYASARHALAFGAGYHCTEQERHVGTSTIACTYGVLVLCKTVYRLLHCGPELQCNANKLTCMVRAVTCTLRAVTCTSRVSTYYLIYYQCGTSPFSVVSGMLLHPCISLNPERPS